jgi:hypothetical protein
VDSFFTTCMQIAHMNIQMLCSCFFVSLLGRGVRVCGKQIRMLGYTVNVKRIIPAEKKYRR